MSAPADEDDGSVHAGDLLHLPDKMRIDVPIGSVIPSHMLRADGMADEEELHLAAAVDEDRLGIGVEEIECFLGLEVLHAKKSITGPRRT